MAEKPKKIDRRIGNGGPRAGAGAPTKYRADTPKVFAELLEKGKTICAACQAYGISLSTYKKWRDEKEEFRDAVTEAQEHIGDVIELALFKRIEAGDTAAIIFAAKTRLRNRGYQERQELVGADGAPIIPKITFTGQLSEEEAAKL